MIKKLKVYLHEINSISNCPKKSEKLVRFLVVIHKQSETSQLGPVAMAYGQIFNPKVGFYDLMPYLVSKI